MRAFRRLAGDTLDIRRRLDTRLGVIPTHGSERVNVSATSSHCRSHSHQASVQPELRCAHFLGRRPEPNGTSASRCTPSDDAELTHAPRCLSLRKAPPEQLASPRTPSLLRPASERMPSRMSVLTPRSCASSSTMHAYLASSRSCETSPSRRCPRRDFPARAFYDARVSARRYFFVGTAFFASAKICADFLQRAVARG